MCTESFEVVGLQDKRTAYEVEEYLLGLPNVTRAQADVIRGEITVEYNESQMEHDHVLDHIEHAGCKPSARIDGVIDHIKTKLGAM